MAVSDPLILLARSRALQFDNMELGAFLASVPHIDQLARDAKGAAAAQAVRRLTEHFDLVIDCLEQSKAIANAGFELEWEAGLSSFEPRPLKSRPDLPIYVLSTVDTLRLKAFVLVALNRVRDYLDLDELSRRAGPRPTAAAVAVLDQVFTKDGAERAPLATQLVRRLAKPRRRVSGSPTTSTSPTAKRWEDMAVIATTLSSQILLTEEPRGLARADFEGRSVESMVQAIREGDLVDWQHMADVVRRKPWGDFARSIAEAAEAAGDGAIAAALREVVEFSRALRDGRERAEIAKRITRSVATSGLTQKAFAARIGTSASRLSTYASGTVTPSASMMLRIGGQKAEIDDERKHGLL